MHRIYREPELNLRIRPRRELEREKLDELAVPEASNHVWSIEFMADLLAEDHAGERSIGDLRDTDRSAVIRLFELLRDVAAELEPSLQIIVT